MIRNLLFILILFIRIPGLHAQTVKVNDSVQATIVLIGDGGQLIKGRHPVVSGVTKTIAMNSKTTIIFLGDNLYKTGLPDNTFPTYEIAKAPLDSQIGIAGKAPVNVYFIPGNHDWANGSRIGYESILRVQNYIDVLGNKYVRQLPRNGCPGPVEEKINDDVTLVMVDSQWWLQEYEKPGVESDCPCKTKAEVITQLEDIMEKNDKKFVIFAMHHPIRSYGPHGGFFTLKQHIFPLTDVIPKLYIPLPLIGSIYPLTRAVFGTAQDLKHPLYQEMITAFENVVKGHKNVIFVSGHEHTLQLIKDTNYINIVSGSGSKNSRVSKSRNTVFASGDYGFVTLDVLKNKSVRSTFYNVDGDNVKEVFTQNILDFSKAKALKGLSDTTRVPDFVFKDSAVISASDKYKNEKKLKDALLGVNYRREWNTPVQFKVFNLRKEKGGFTIKGIGGGKQSKSLKLEDKNGKEWTLRTIDKDPEKAVPENLRGNIGQAILVDVISASNPYAPLTIPVLAKAAGVPAANPQFFFVPDDPAFGYYRPVFKNTVCMLEEKQPTPDETDTKSTNAIINKLFEQNDYHINQPAVLRARLLDMLIGDFDIHADQWRWGTKDTVKGKVYYPVPKDRDQAYFNSNGLLLKYLSNNSMPFLQGFKSKIKNINGLNFVAKDFDRIFMNGLSKEQWKTISDSFVYNINNEVIKIAASKYPPEIKQFDSIFTAQKLMSRRDDLPKQAMKYYNFLARGVTVTGSNEADYFHIQNDNGGIKLSVYNKNKDGDTTSLNYQRTFTHKETKELFIYGLNGNDKFVVDDNVSSRIKLRIVGGKGNDSFYLGGNIKKTLYDLSTEKNVIEKSRRTEKMFSKNPSVLEYKNTGFQYDKFIFPQINFGFNAEDKILLGLGFSSNKHGFRKEPYASLQKLTTLAAITLGAFQVKYEGIFNNIVLKNDLVINGELQIPTLTNFFGYGNQSNYNKNLPLSYYRTRYKYGSFNVAVRKRFNDIFQISIGPSYFRYWNDVADNKNRILSVPSSVGRDSLGLYTSKEYLGGKVKLDINYINNEIFPTRGITWFTTLSSLKGLNNYSNSTTDIESDMTIYASISDLSKVSGVLRFGGARIFSNNFEFFQAKSLGVQNYLRGYRRNRFSGKAMAYGSGELRCKIFKSKSFVLPGDVGILGFADFGRVWQDNENSKKWHNSFGGGFYFIPFNLITITATVAVSKEERLFNFSFGTKFNLIF